MAMKPGTHHNDPETCAKQGCEACAEVMLEFEDPITQDDIGRQRHPVPVERNPAAKAEAKAFRLRLCLTTLVEAIRHEPGVSMMTCSGALHAAIGVAENELERMA